MQPQAGTARSSARPSRILIVDDHEVSRAALRALLRTEGIDVADMRTGGAAVTPTPPGSSSPDNYRCCRTPL